jgi:hypothetical protein
VCVECVCDVRGYMCGVWYVGVCCVVCGVYVWCVCVVWGIVCVCGGVVYVGVSGYGCSV